MAGSAQIVGRVGIRVVPDTSLFKEQLRAQLKGMRDEVQPVNLQPNVAGFNKGFRRMLGGINRSVPKVNVDADFRPGVLQRLASRLAKGISLGNLGDDVDLGGLTRFERVLLNAHVHVNRMYAALREIARNMQYTGKHADYTRIAWDQIGRNLANIPKHLRDGLRNADPYGSTLDQINAVLRNMGRYVTDVRGRFDDLRRVSRSAFSEVNDQASGFERIFGNRIRRTLAQTAETARRLAETLRIVERPDYIGVHREEMQGLAEQAGRHRREVIGARQVWDSLKHTVRQINDEFRAMREISSYNRLQLVDEDAPRLIQRMQGSTLNLVRHSESLKREWFNIQFTFSRAAALLRNFAKNSVGAMDVWRRIGEGARNAVENIKQMRQLPAMLVRSQRAQEGVYRGFVGLGDAAIVAGERGVRGLGRLRGALGGIRGSFLHPIRTARQLGGTVNNLRQNFHALPSPVRAAGKALGGIAKNVNPVRALTKTVGAGAGLFKRFAGAIGNAVSNMMDLSPHAKRTAGLVALILAVLPALVGLVGGVLAGLPSLLMAAGAGFATIYLGLDGIKAAASRLQPEFDRMKASVSATFEKGLAPVFERLKPLFPVFTAGFNEIAKSMVGWASGITDVVVKAQEMGIWEKILGNTAKFFADLTPFLQSSLRGFLAWSAAGSDLFGILSGQLNKFGADWEALANRVIQNGSFEKAIKGLALVTQSLFDNWLVLLEYGIEAMGRLGEPIAGLVDGIVQLFLGLSPVLEFLFVALSGIVQFLGAAIGPAFAALGPVVEGVSAVFMQLVDTLSTAVGPVLQMVFEQAGILIQKLLDTLAPILPKIGELFMALGSAISEALAPVLPALVDAIVMVVQALVDALMPVLPVIIDVLSQLGQTLGTAITDALRVIVPFLQQLAAIFMELWVAITPLIPALLNLAMVVFKALLDIIIALMPILVQIIESVLPKLVDVIRIVAPALAQIVNLFAELVPVVADFVVWLIGNLIPAFETVHSITNTIWNGVRTIIAGVLDFIMGLLNVFIGVITGDWQRCWDGVKQILSGAIQVLIGIFIGLVPAVLDILRGLYNGITGFFSNAGRWLWNAGRAILQGLWDGMKSIWNTIVGWVRSSMNWLRGFFPFSPAKRGPFAGRGYTTHSGRALMEDFGRGMVAGATAAFSAADDVMSRIQNTMTRPIDPTMNLGGELNRFTSSAEFGISSDGIAAAVAEGITGATLRVDGNGVARLVNKTNTRRERRG